MNRQTMVILGAGQMGHAAQTLLSPNQVKLLAFGDNAPHVWNPMADPPILSVTEALALSPDIILLGTVDEERNLQLERQARSLDFKGTFLRLANLQRSFDIRSATLRHLCERIRQIPGNLAELGVYRGDFAWQLNAYFPDRKLYLFDTFRGFDNLDLQQEPLRTARGQDFSNTSVQTVLSRLPHPEQVVLRQGWFPQTAQGLNATFSLVSLDVDLYAPTLAGLEFFYPRLNSGGVILLHDFNSNQFPGVKRAVSEYEVTRGPLLLIPLPDLHGTAAIIHP